MRLSVSGETFTSRGLSMSLATVSEIQAHLARYLSARESLGQFKEWFDRETWGLAAEPDSAARRLAGEIELDLAEFTGGYLGENELREALRSLVPSDIEIEMDYQTPVTCQEPVLETF
jgi:hypothetical protein